MLKFVDTKEVFAEVPDEISLAISISGCPIHCKGCHSKYLWKDVGEPLTSDILEILVKKHQGITCVLFSGGDNDPATINTLAKWVKDNTELKVAWYSGNNLVSKEIDRRYFDYIKTGPYDEKYGPLTSKTTNQTLLKRISEDYWEDITSKFNESKN